MNFKKFYFFVSFAIILFHSNDGHTTPTGCYYIPDHPAIQEAVDKCGMMGGALPGGAARDSCQDEASFAYPCLLCQFSPPAPASNYFIPIPLPFYCPASQPGDPRTPTPGGVPPGDTRCGSDINVDQQSVSESVGIAGSPFRLHYNSKWTPGRLAQRKLNVNLTNSTLPLNANQVDLRIVAAGRTFSQSYTSLSAYMQYNFTWDGLDASMQEYPDLAPAEIVVETYRPSIGTYPVPTEVWSRVIPLGTPDFRKRGIGGWTLSIHHYAVEGTLILGTGEEVNQRPAVIKGFGNKSGYVSSDQSEIYIFDNGRHVNTLNGTTGTIKYTFNYDLNNLLVSVVDAYSNETEIHRDISGKPTAIVSPHGQVTTLETDTNGYLKTIENPLIEKTEMTYYSGGLLHTFKRPGGVISTMTYDTNGLLASDTSTAGAGWALSSSVYNPDPTRYGKTVTLESILGIGSTHTNYHDSTNYYYRTQEGEGISSRTNIYTSFNNQRDKGINFKWEISPSNVHVKTNFQTDARFQNKSTFPSYIQQSPDNGYPNKATSISRTSNLSDPDDPLSLTSKSEDWTTNSKTTNMTYNSATRLYTFTTPMSRVSTLKTDTQEKITEYQQAGFTPWTVEYDLEGRVIEVAQGVSRVYGINYNSNGFVSSRQNALGQTVSYTYDDVGRMLTQTFPDARTVQFTYDINGNLASVTPPGKSTHDFSYNGFDYVSEYLTANPTTYAYNADRKLISIERPNGDEINYVYNTTTGRLTSITTPYGNYSFTPSSWSYNQSMTSPDNVVSWLSYTGDFLNGASNSGATAGSTYVQYNLDHNVDYTRVNANPSRYRAYNNDDQLTSTGDQSMTYDSTTGLLQTEELGDVTVAYDYSSTYGELEEIEATYAPTANIYKANYTRDHLGRITSKTEKIGAGASNVYGYIYDSGGRLTDVTLNSNPYHQYGYDDNGNRQDTDYGAGNISATFNGFDEILTFGTKTYTHNANGERTSVTDTASMPSAVISYTYDAFGQLKTATFPSTDVYNYLYDGFGRRVGIKLNGVLIKQYTWYDKLKVAAEMDGSGNIISEFIYGTKVNVPEYMLNGADKYKFVTDHLGSVRAVVNIATGVVAQEITYDEFGKVLSDSNPGFQPFGFAGGLYDATTGLVKFGARDYDGETGRWLSKDPILFKGGDANLYGYVLNDPINGIDPEGLKVFYISFGGSTVVGSGPGSNGPGKSTSGGLGFGFDTQSGSGFFFTNTGSGTGAGLYGGGGFSAGYFTGSKDQFFGGGSSTGVSGGVGFLGGGASLFNSNSGGVGVQLDFFGPGLGAGGSCQNTNTK